MRSFVLIILLLAGTASAQTSLKEGPKVNGLGLGDRREDILRWMGKPASQSKKKADECVGGTELTLRYPGLVFSLWDDPRDPKKFTVGAFEVTSARWDVSGSKVGQNYAAIRKLFGTRGFEGKEDRTRLPFWSYEMDEEKSPGTTTFVFRGGRLVKVTAMWMMC